MRSDRLVVGLGATSPVLELAECSIRKDTDHSDDVTDNHGDSAASISGRLLLTKRLGSNDVAGGPGDIEPGVQGNLLGVPGNVCLVDGDESDIRRPIGVENAVKGVSPRWCSMRMRASTY